MSYLVLNPGPLRVDLVSEDNPQCVGVPAEHVHERVRGHFGPQDVNLVHRQDPVTHDRFGIDEEDGRHTQSRQNRPGQVELFAQPVIQRQDNRARRQRALSGDGEPDVVRTDERSDACERLDLPFELLRREPMNRIEPAVEAPAGCSGS